MYQVTEFDINDVRIKVEDAPEVAFPAHADCNSPCWWQGGSLNILTSTGHPVLSSGQDFSTLAVKGEITYTAYRDGGRWMEAVHQTSDGTLFGWYHNEPAHLMPPEMQEGRRFPLTAPFIGATVSYDNGLTWDDLGLVLAGGTETLNLATPNFFFAGGNGDFTVILDRRQEFFYFVFGTYYRNPEQQGVSLARMRVEDLHAPVGKVMKWHEGSFSEPGLNGQVTPIFPVVGDWYGPNPDAFWGPSIHWNTEIEQYVILMNRAVDRNWKQSGVYIVCTADLADPEAWSEPQLALEVDGWYPQVIGSDTEKRETDREAGHVARLFIHGKSRHQICFAKRS